MKQCLVCNLEITGYGKKFCSLKCAHQYIGKTSGETRRRQKLESYFLNQKYCKQCKKPIAYDEKRKIFCNQSCAASFNNVIKKRNKIPPKECLECKLPIKKNSKKFCSSKCCRIYINKQYIERWLNGLEKGYVGGNNSGEQVSAIIKKWLIVQRGEKCEDCGWAKVNQATGKIPIQIHHKDGNCRNNKPENLMLICPNCHSLTPHFGALNKGNGRNGRYKKRL